MTNGQNNLESIVANSAGDKKNIPITKKIGAELHKRGVPYVELFGGGGLAFLGYSIVSTASLIAAGGVIGAGIAFALLGGSAIGKGLYDLFQSYKGYQ